MEGWCIVLYVIVHISVRRWTHGRVVEGGRVYFEHEIVRNSILQAGSCLRNVVEPREWVTGAYNFWLWLFWRVMDIQWSFCGKIVAGLWIQHRGTDREYNFQGKLIAPTSHLAQLGMTYNFFECINGVRMNCYVLYDPRIMHPLVKTWGW